MRRFTRSFRTRKNVRRSSALEQQFLRELARESERLMKQLTEQFDQTLQAQLNQALQSFAGSGPAIAPANDGSSLASVKGIGQLLNTGLRLLVSRPRTSRDSVESTRSIETTASFRVSQAQVAAELQMALAKGEKNT